MRLQEKTKTRTSESGSLNFNLYQLIEAVDSSVKPGEEDMVPYIVRHLLSTYNATTHGNA